MKTWGTDSIVIGPSNYEIKSLKDKLKKKINKIKFLKN